MDLKYKRESRSQVAEDLLASFYLGEENKIVYVDIGCLWPVKFSNTYYFYERGGHGICIDPNPSVAASYQEVRPRDIFFNSAVGGVSEMRSYYEFDNPVFNTLDSARAAKLDAKNRPGRKIIRTTDVPVKPLVDILQESKFLASNPSIYFMSIDVEGLEMELISAIDFSVVTPRVIVIETMIKATSVNSSPVVNHFDSVGYELVGFTGHDAFFRKKR